MKFVLFSTALSAISLVLPATASANDLVSQYKGEWTSPKSSNVERIDFKQGAFILEECSEYMKFQGYGYHSVTILLEKRGSFLVAPTPLGPIPLMIDEKTGTIDFDGQQFSRNTGATKWKCT